MPSAASDPDLGAPGLSWTEIPLNREAPEQTRVGQLTFLAGFDLTAKANVFGGYSGLQVAPEGGQLTAISDRGHWLTLDLQHDATGRLRGFGPARLQPLLDRAGNSVLGTRNSDAEALAPVPEGGFLVAFEGRHRIWHYREVGGKASLAPQPPSLAGLPRNNGIEALVRTADGQLLALSEGVATRPGTTRGWIGRDNRWREIAVATPGNYKPTDLALLPSGDLIMVERHFALLGGLHARISLILRQDLEGEPTILPRPLALLDAPLTLDNFEGIAARLGPRGETLIYLISDDNHFALQRTLLLQFRLGD